MSRMTFDEMLDFLTRRTEIESEEDFSEKTTELMNEILEVGHKVLENRSQEQIAGMLTLIQITVLTKALQDGNIMLAALAQSDMFADSLLVIFSSTAGILTMQEIR